MLKAGEGTAAALRRQAGIMMRDCSMEIPGSVSDAYPYEVNEKEIYSKRFLRQDVLQPGWTFELKQGNMSAVPFAVSPSINSTAISFHVAIDGKSTGPYGEMKIKEMVDSGLLTRETKVWKKGMTGWLQAEQVIELIGLFDLPPSLDDEPPPID